MGIVIPVRNEKILLISQCCITDSEFWLSPNPTLIPTFDSQEGAALPCISALNAWTMHRAENSACSVQATLSLRSKAVCVSGLLVMELKSACINAADFICCVTGANFHSLCFVDWLFQLHRGSSCVTRFGLALVTQPWSITMMCEDQLSQVQVQQSGPVEILLCLQQQQHQETLQPLV